MNIYADRGNILLLERRCAWRGIGFSVTPASFGEAIDPDAHDLFYLGGGQDRDQLLCAQDLVETKRDALHAAAGRGAIVLGVCGGYQLLGHGYGEMPGVGLVDVSTVREDGDRLIGNVAIEVELEPGRTRVLAGFENHAGRTSLGPGRAAAGPRAQGTRQRRALGRRGRAPRQRHRHLPATARLLPKNAWFADWLIEQGTGERGLVPLDDALEDAAHRSARQAAGVG
jgi:CobQ-like glutamine amidotransferase family enzyme